MSQRTEHSGYAPPGEPVPDWDGLRKIAFGVALFYLGNRDDAEDLAQETMSIFLAQRNVVQIENPGGFIRNTAWQQAMNHGRRRRMVQFSQVAGPFLQDPPDRRTPEASDAVADAECVPLLKEILEALPPADRDLVLLRLDGSSFANLADQRGGTEAAARVQYARVLRRVREQAVDIGIIE